jgi:hypothetical protein
VRDVGPVVFPPSMGAKGRRRSIIMSAVPVESETASNVEASSQSWNPAARIFFLVPGCSDKPIQEARHYAEDVCEASVECMVKIADTNIRKTIEFHAKRGKISEEKMDVYTKRLIRKSQLILRCAMSG